MRAHLSPNTVYLLHAEGKGDKHDQEGRKLGQKSHIHSHPQIHKHKQHTHTQPLENDTKDHDWSLPVLLFCKLLLIIRALFLVW
jgi:hypothetical protein